MTTTATGGGAPGLGLRENLPQFVLLVGINALVGGMVGQERTLVPLLAEDTFGLTAYTGALSFIVVFGVAKAFTNLAAGALADRYGRKPVLVAGWVAGIPVPFMLIWAPTWGWILAANVLLGVNQGLAWSVTVIMKIDLVGPRRRGTALGFNEAAGYGAIAVASWATGWIAAGHGLRPEPFYLGIAFAGLGLGLSAAFARETAGHATREAATVPRPAGPSPTAGPSFGRVFALATWRDRSLAAASRAGLVNNLNEGMAWGLFPLYFAAGGLSVGAAGALIAVAPAVWGVGQLFTGALSDRIGRKPLITGGQWTEAAGLVVIAVGRGPTAWVVGSVLFGAGTAMAYPTLIAAVSDTAHPTWRGAAVGVYRLWRDLGFAVGAVTAGVLADAAGVRTAILAIAVVTALSGVDVAVRMAETHRPTSGGEAALQRARARRRIG